jgi:hypothetical protein
MQTAARIAENTSRANRLALIRAFSRFDGPSTRPRARPVQNYFRSAALAVLQSLRAQKLSRMLRIARQ